ncbi:N-acetylmuramoyl-L-alanine amidase [Mesorhizobium sp. B1-1-8]|uniref:N-acetylmuramoyl-L-alanine amidase n=1 Tax=Mesorhizobium sp. B1-1-8 TaxID=2589976 RepID=UPI001129EB86|nr:N-acetylmuramoyl-L-alanine amidase [Mesorhizobium sp. B1-1-8]UCI09190.1 N-acetylmuramoyl-L-alanine amidase [Mesorhizobium sp. B1-1-8]
MKLPFKPWLDQAGKFSIAHIPGIPHYNTAVSATSPRTGVLHTTEGGWLSSLTIFKQHYAPHFMLGYDAAAKEVRIAQLVQIGTIGAALKAHNSKALVQIEMIGFSKEAPWLPDDETSEALASLMAVCNVEYQIPLSRPWKDGDFGKAGNNPHRSSGKFGVEPGWYGHGDCPNPDSHWDPGNLKWTTIFARAGVIAESMSPSSFEVGPIAMAGVRAGFPLQGLG